MHYSSHGCFYLTHSVQAYKMCHFQLLPSIRPFVFFQSQLDFQQDIRVTLHFLVNSYKATKLLCCAAAAGPLWCVTTCAGNGAVRLSLDQATGRLYYTDWSTGSINVIDVLQSDTGPRPLITGLSSPLPITVHPQNRYRSLSHLVIHQLDWISEYAELISERYWIRFFSSQPYRPPKQTFSVQKLDRHKQLNTH